MSTSNKSTVAVTVEKVVVEEMPDHAELEAKQVKAAADVVESNTRAGYVAGLKTELAFLERQPTPKAGRVADVKAQLAQYGEKPANAAREAAVPDCRRV
jgi:hypothetical protein